MAWFSVKEKYSDNFTVYILNFIICFYSAFYDALSTATGLTRLE